MISGRHDCKFEPCPSGLSNHLRYIARVTILIDEGCELESFIISLLMIPTYHISDFPSPQSIAGQFMLERFERLTRPKNLQWPHKHSFYEVMWLTSGTSTNVIDYHQITVEPNSLFFISPGQLHLMSKAAGVTGYSLTFTEEFLQLHTTNKEIHLELSFLDNSYAAPYFQLDRADVAELQPVLSLLLKEITRPEKTPPIVGHLLFTFLHQIQRLVTKKNPAVQDVANAVKFKKFKKLLEKDFKTQRTIGYYSKKFSLTPHRINEICKQVSGRTAGEVNPTVWFCSKVGWCSYRTK